MEKFSNCIKHINNPFIMDENIPVADKKRFFKIGENDSLMTTDGEVLPTATYFLKNEKVDREPYIKVYPRLMQDWFPGMTKAGKMIFQYILSKLKPNQDIVVLSIEDAMKELDISKNTVYTGLMNLIILKMIAKTSATNAYYINPLLFFNGDRKVVFAKIFDFGNAGNKTITEMAFNRSKITTKEDNGTNGPEPGSM